MTNNNVLLRITTVPISLNKLIAGQAKYMTQKGMKVYLASAAGEDVQKVVERENVEHFVVSYTRVISPIQDVFTLIKTILLIKKLNPSIVHTHTPKAGLIGMMASYLCRVPVRMHTVAGLPLLEATGIKRKLLNLIEKITSFCATYVYPNSFELKQIMIENKLSKPYKTKVIGNGSSNGIDTTYFSHNAIGNQQHLKIQYGIKETDIVCCFVGRVVADKGVSELVDAFSQVETINKNVKLLLVGPKESDLDPLSDHTLGIINKLDSIIEVGYQEDVRSFLAISDVFVFPSYREGFPNVVMQAGAFNLPCIVSNINGCNELITHGENGEIIPVKDTTALYESIKRVVEDAAYRNKLGVRSRVQIVEKYEQQFVWSEIHKEYNTLINEKGTR